EGLADDGYAAIRQVVRRRESTTGDQPNARGFEVAVAGNAGMRLRDLVRRRRRAIWKGDVDGVEQPAERKHRDGPEVADAGVGGQSSAERLVESDDRGASRVPCRRKRELNRHRALGLKPRVDLSQP